MMGRVPACGRSADIVASLELAPERDLRLGGDPGTAHDLLDLGPASWKKSWNASWLGHSSRMGLHEVEATERELGRLHLDRETPPSTDSWRAALEIFSSTYAQGNDDCYTLERSIEVSSGEMRNLHKDLTRQASLDPLTGLLNRAGLIRHLTQSLAACASAGDGLAVLFVDLDGFKQVNDSLGHAVGDELLMLAGQRIGACLRPPDVVARLGGDEFVVVCPHLHDTLVAPGIAARIGSQLAAPFPIMKHHAVISASIGLATTIDGTTSAEDLLGQADLAMYEAKIRGKSRSALFTKSMQQVVDTRFSIRNALSLAITTNELRVMYQPIVSLADERVLGVEALVRWERPGFGLLLPEDFIPIAEDNSLISAVDCWMLDEVCSRGAPWCAAGGTIAVNISARTLRQGTVVGVLREALARSGIPAGKLTVEITETTLLSGTGSAELSLRHLREIGVRLSIDDFGTGHSSLSQLQRTDVDVLKIDECFVSGMDQDRVSAAIVCAIITLGHALGLTLIAEGVERPAQAALLREQGCEAAQGWLFGRPVPANDIDGIFSSE
jgi:diguanylate cyclase